MKTPSQKSLVIISIVALLLGAFNAEAATNYWDNNGASAATSGTWDTGAKWALNPTLTASPVVFTNGNIVDFAAGSTTISALTITLNSGVTIAGLGNGGYSTAGGALVTGLTISGTGSITLASGTDKFYCGVNSAVGNVTATVPIQGSGLIEQHGSGFLALYTNNSYSGGTSTTGGQLIYYNNSSSFGTGAITIGGTGGAMVNGGGSAITLANNVSFTTTGWNLNLASGLPVAGAPGTTWTGTWTLPAGTTTLLTGGTGQVTEISGVISGVSGAGVAVGDPGILELGGVNTYNGGTTLTNNLGTPTLIIVGSGSLGSGSYAGKITNFGVFAYSSSAAQNFSGVISGTGPLIQNGAGNLTLSAVETYTGGTSNGSTLIIGGAGTITAAGKITNNGTFNYNSSASETISGVISGTGALTVSSGTLALSGANTYTGINTVSGGTLNVNADASSVSAPLGAPPGSFVANQITLSGGTLGLTATAADITTNRGITLTANSTVSATSGQSPSIESVITGGFGLTKVAAGNLSLNAANTFTGGLTITGGGVRFNNDQAAGPGTITVTPVSIVTLRNITPPSGATTTLTNTVVLNANSGSDIDLTVASGNTLALTGPISGVGYFTRGRASGGGGTVSLSGSNTFTGGLFLEGGTLSVGSSNALGTGTLSIQPGGNNQVILQASTPLTGANAITNAVNIIVTSTTNLVLGGSSALELAGPVGLSNSVSSAVTISNNNSGGTIISGPVSSMVSGIGLTVSGTNSNTLTLNGTNTYNGNTTISGGTLALGATGSISSSPAISIAASATLDVSAISAYALGSSTLSASGTSNAATINGNASGTVDFGSQGITLTYDGSHPALTVAQGTLLLNGNLFTVNGSPLTAGTYVIVHQAAGSITSPGSLTVSGSAIRPGTIASISVSGGDVDLVIQYESPIFSALTASTNVTYGVSSLTLSGTLSATSPGTVYPTNGETITVTINGTPQTTTISDSTGDFTINYNPSTIPASGTPYPITYSYAGGLLLNPTNDASTTLTVNAALLAITASGQSKPYGQTVSFGSGSTNFSSLGLKNGETVGSVTLAVSGSGGASNAPISGSPYTITPSAAAGGTFNPNNYAISYNPGLLTVTPAVLTITADNLSRPFGATNPVFTVSYSNFVNGETLVTSDLAGAAALATAADTNSDIGTYVITNAVGTLTSTNYSFSFVNGTLTVTNALSTNTVTADVNPALPAATVTLTSTLSALAPSLAVPGGTVQFLTNGTAYGSAVTLTNGAAAVTISTLPHGSNTIEADFAGTTNLAGGTNILGSTNTLSVLINTPPVAGLATYQRPADTALTINISDLLTNATDADGDPLTLVSVSSTSTNGATVTNDGTYIHYLPPATNGNVTDSFLYSVSDNFGATNQGTVVVTVFSNNGPSVNITGLTTLGNGTALISFAGIPNRSYLVEATTNLTPTIVWTILSTNTAGTNGLFQYNDLDSTNFGLRYYRTSTP